MTRDQRAGAIGDNGVDDIDKACNASGDAGFFLQFPQGGIARRLTRFDPTAGK